MAKVRKARLGRGLSSLMSNVVSVDPPAQADEHATARTPQTAAPAGDAAGGAAETKTNQHTQPADGMAWLDIEAIEPNPYQPRRSFDDGTLDQLADSIRQDGVMQPVIVRRQGGDGCFQLVAGERRWRAAKRAGIGRLPAIIRDLDDRKLAEWAVIENLQREDLDPIERAEAFARLIDRFGLSHQQVADHVGIDRSTITNILRLLDLHNDIHELVRRGRLSAGHGRALLGLSDVEAQLALARRAAAGGWSVRMVEAAVKRATQSAEPTSKRKSPGARSTHLADLEQQIAVQLQTRVRIKAGRKKGSGTLCIDFYDLDQFDTLLRKLGVDVG